MDRQENDGQWGITHNKNITLEHKPSFISSNGLWEYLSLETLNDLANQTPGDAVGLDHNEGLLVVGHFCRTGLPTLLWG
jgi:hypothetical protein